MKLDYKNCGICLDQTRKAHSSVLQFASTQQNKTGNKQRTNSENQIKNFQLFTLSDVANTERSKRAKAIPQKGFGENLDFQTTVRFLEKDFKRNHLAFTPRSTQNQKKLSLLIQPVRVGLVLSLRSCSPLSQFPVRSGKLVLPLECEVLRDTKYHFPFREFGLDF